MAEYNEIRSAGDTGARGQDAVLQGSIVRSIFEIETYVASRLSPLVSDPKAEIYAYTQTFKSIKSTGPRGQFKETAPYLTKLLGRSCDYCIVPEWRTGSGEIHYHGVIIIKDKVKWLRSTRGCLVNLGFLKLKSIDNMQKWMKYFLKEVVVAEEITKLSMPMFDPVILSSKVGSTKGDSFFKGP